MKNATLLVFILVCLVTVTALGQQEGVAPDVYPIFGRPTETATVSPATYLPPGVKTLLASQTFEPHNTATLTAAPTHLPALSPAPLAMTATYAPVIIPMWSTP